MAVYRRSRLMELKSAIEERAEERHKIIMAAIETGVLPPPVEG